MSRSPAQAQSYQRVWCWHWCGPACWRPRTCSSHSHVRRHWRRWALRGKVCFPLWALSFLLPVWDRRKRHTRRRREKVMVYHGGIHILSLGPFPTLPSVPFSHTAEFIPNNTDDMVTWQRSAGDTLIIYLQVTPSNAQCIFHWLYSDIISGGAWKIIWGS